MLPKLIWILGNISNHSHKLNTVRFKSKKTYDIVLNITPPTYLQYSIVLLLSHYLYQIKDSLGSYYSYKAQSDVSFIVTTSGIADL